MSKKTKNKLQSERTGEVWLWFFDPEISNEEFKKHFNQLFGMGKADRCLDVEKARDIGRVRVCRKNRRLASFF